MAAGDGSGRGRPSRVRVVTALAAGIATLAAAAILGASGPGAANDSGATALAGSSSPGTAGTSAAASDAAAALGVRQTVAATFTFPGAAPQLAWPARGQAALSVVGLGSLGGSGPADSPVPIASIAKTMTAYLVLQDHPLADGQNGPTITVSAGDAAVYQKEAATTEDSLVPVQAGEQLTERDALYALMLSSADNVAQILAAWDAGSVPAFLTRMNTTAAEIGMTHTVFTDPSGLDAATMSTAQDLVALGETVMQWDDFRRLVSTRWAIIPVAGLIRNYDGLLGMDGVIGIKTGSTNEAGSCLLFAASVTVGGQAVTLVGAVLGQYLGSGRTLLTSAMQAAGALVVSGEQALGTATVAAPGTEVAAVERGGTRVGALTVAAPLTVIGWPGLRYRVSVVSGGAPGQVTQPSGGPSPTAGSGASPSGSPNPNENPSPRATKTAEAGPPADAIAAIVLVTVVDPSAAAAGPLTDAGSLPAALQPLRPSAPAPGGRTG
ncbi:MAG TPA: hypothetical protein VGX23_22305 [Actinocrinis sp.]|nr:hypothetical protein [Actinocrinis sp.]